MKNKIYTCLFILGLFAAIIFSSCTSTPHYDFSLKDTLSVFLLDNGKNNYFCIPVQYLGDYQITGFEFDNGNILIGEYDILLNRNEINIYVYLNEDSDEEGNSDSGFKLIYSEENGRVLTSRMGEPLTKHESDEKMNHYYIFIEKYLSNDDMKRLASEYERGNMYSKLSIWYDIAFDNEEQSLSGMLDDFELYDGPAIDTSFIPNLNFFRAKYLQ